MITRYRHIWSELVIPSLLCSALLALCALGIMQSWLAASLMVVTCWIISLFHTLSIIRNEKLARTQIMYPELRTDDTHAGVYQQIVELVTEIIEKQQQAVQNESQYKLKLDARNQLHRKHSTLVKKGLNAVQLPMLIVDGYDRLQYANPAAQMLFQFGEQAEQKELSEILQNHSQLIDLIQQTRARHEVLDQRMQELSISSENSTTAYRATTTNIYKDEDSLLGTIAILENIEAEQAERTRHAEFVSSVCHELKTPMSSIKAFLEMLMDGEVEDRDEQLELFGFIDIQVDRLTRLVNNMLNLARIESGVIKTQRDDCDLNEILSKSISIVKPMAEEKQISLQTELSELYLPVHVDPDLFSQAIINLMSNAVKYTPQGGQVTLRSRLESGEIVIDVRDTGMGIPPESLEKIFDRFYRVPENNKAAKGTGLGLALVNGIVTELHNGKLNVTSDVGQGSCFSIHIPKGHRHSSSKTTPLQPATV